MKRQEIIENIYWKESIRTCINENIQPPAFRSFCYRYEKRVNECEGRYFQVTLEAGRDKETENTGGKLKRKRRCVRG